MSAALLRTAAIHFYLLCKVYIYSWDTPWCPPFNDGISHINSHKHTHRESARERKRKKETQVDCYTFRRRDSSLWVVIIKAVGAKKLFFFTYMCICSSLHEKRTKLLLSSKLHPSLVFPHAQDNANSKSEEDGPNNSINQNRSFAISFTASEYETRCCLYISVPFPWPLPPHPPPKHTPSHPCSPLCFWMVGYSKSQLKYLHCPRCTSGFNRARGLVCSDQTASCVCFFLSFWNPDATSPFLKRGIRYAMFTYNLSAVSVRWYHQNLHE